MAAEQARRLHEQKGNTVAARKVAGLLAELTAEASTRGERDPRGR